MSGAFLPRGGPNPPPNSEQMSNILLENNVLIQLIHDYQKKGKSWDCYQYQKILHRNVIYLAWLADASKKKEVK